MSHDNDSNNDDDHNFQSIDIVVLHIKSTITITKYLLQRSKHLSKVSPPLRFSQPLNNHTAIRTVLASPCSTHEK